MKQSVLSFAFVAIAVFVFSMPIHASAQTSIGVVDVERVLNEAKAAKELNKKRSDAREKFLSSLSKKEQKLREDGKALFERRKDLSDEEFIKEQKKYEAELLEVRKLTQKQKRAFEEASGKALETLKDHLEEAVKEIAQEKGYGLVISNRNVIAGENSLDVTADTLKMMDAKKIKIPFEVKL